MYEKSSAMNKRVTCENLVKYCNPCHLEKNGIKIVMDPLSQNHRGSKATAVSQHANYQYRVIYSDLSPDVMKQRFRSRYFIDHASVAKYLDKKRLRTGRSKDDVSTVRKFMDKLGRKGLPLWNGERFLFKERYIKSVNFTSLTKVLTTTVPPVQTTSEVINELKKLLEGGTAIGTMVLFEGGQAKKGYPQFGQWVYEGSESVNVRPDHQSVVILGIVEVDSELSLKLQCDEGEYVLYQESRGFRAAGDLSIFGDGLCLAHPRVFVKAYQIPCHYFRPQVLMEPEVSPLMEPEASQQL